MIYSRPMPIPPNPHLYFGQEFERYQAAYLADRADWDREVNRNILLHSIPVLCAACAVIFAVLLLPGILVDMIQIAAGR